jgi:hypothetical protein
MRIVLAAENPSRLYALAEFCWSYKALEAFFGVPFFQ